MITANPTFDSPEIVPTPDNAANQDAHGDQDSDDSHDSRSGCGGGGELTDDPSLPDAVNRLTRILASESDRIVGEFSFGGSAQDWLPGFPGLEVDGFGPVPLPLTDSELASRLAACGRLAPFGRGSETITDTAIRHTWEFERGQVCLTNPDWDVGVGNLTAMIAERLGYPDLAITSHLYKLLLYGPGSHFVKHQDTEKEEGMFATLVIQLPSEHKGGELVVYDHQKDCQDYGGGSTGHVHDFGAKAGTAAFAPHYAVHFADAEHELKPVTEGYRLALVYSLCWPCDQPQHDGKLDQGVQKSLASSLKSLSDTKSSLHYFLAHSYTEASVCRFGINCLKGTDRNRIFNLMSANRTLDPASQYSIYLVRGQRTVRSGEYETANDVILALYSEKGAELTFKKRPSQWRREQLAEVLGFLVDPDAKDSEELWWGDVHRNAWYTGNAGTEVTEVYHKYIAFMLPATQGDWGLAPVVGVDATFERLVPDPTSVSAATFSKSQFSSNILAMATGTILDVGKHSSDTLGVILSMV